MIMRTVFSELTQDYILAEREVLTAKGWVPTAAKPLRTFGQLIEVEMGAACYIPHTCVIDPNMVCAACLRSEEY
jgi:hypothetical protein